jgi:hypothetical protein
LEVINLTLLAVVGRSDLIFRLTLARKALVVLAILLTYRSGITALLWGQVATAFLAYLLNSYYSSRLIGYSTAQQVRDFIPILSMSLVMGVSMAWVGSVIPSDLLKLFAEGIAGLSVYLILNYFLGRPLLVYIVHLAGRLVRLPVAG